MKRITAHAWILITALAAFIAILYLDHGHLNGDLLIWPYVLPTLVILGEL